MSFSIEFAEDQVSYDARIKVIGVGGSGGNAVNTMINLGLEGVEFMVVNTDAQALNNCLAPTRIQIGTNITRGLGAGADPERGRKAAIEDVNLIKEAISGADMVFITAGMGGGTGTGAAPVIAQLAREEEILAVGVATKPFLFEGKQRSRRAELGLEMLSDQVDTLVTIPNQKLLNLDDDDMSFMDAFRKADEVLYQAVKGISDLITQGGMVNVDFADVRTVMSNMGRALMGTGCAKGDGRSKLAAELAIASPLLDDISVEGAMGVLINVVGGPDMRMREVSDAATLIQEQAHEDANIIFGATIDESMGDAIKVTVIATGFEEKDDIEVIEDLRGAETVMEHEPAVELSRRSAHQRPARAVRTAQAAQPVTRRPPARTAARRAMAEQELPPAAVTEAPPHTVRRPRAETVPAARARGRGERDTRYFSARDDIDWDVPAYQRRSK